MRNPRLYFILGLAAVVAMYGLVLSLPGGGSANAQDKLKPVPAAPPAVVLPAPPGNQAKPEGPAGKPEDEDGFGDRVILPRDRTAERKVARVKEMIQEEDWGNAAKVLQSLLNVKEDVFLQDEKGRWVSVRTEANRIIGQMPRDGQQFYEQQVGAEARKLLKDGLAAGNPQVYADVALRYMHTEAGTEAAGHLGTYHLDHGRYIVAALCYERLLNREGMLEKLPALTLFKAAIAFARAGDQKNRERVWAQLTQRLDNGDRLPGSLRRLEPDQLKAMLALRETSRPNRERADWPMFLGSGDRAALADGGAPFLAPRFTISMTYKPRERPETREFSSQAKDWVERALTRHSSRAQAQLCGFHPIAVGGKLVFRSYWGVHAHDLKTGELVWEAPTLMSLNYLAAKKDRIDVNQQLFQWTNTYLQHTPTIFYDNTTLGTLSADGSKVYFVEDIAIPPHPSHMQNMNWRQLPQLSGELARWMDHNKLSAYDLQSGKLKWEIGTDKPDEAFTGAFFLGPPLPLGGRLYLLAEIVGTGEIRLFCIENRRVNVPGEQEQERGEAVWSQTLCLVDRRIVEDPSRRTQAAHLAYGDGVLICPTNAGVVLAVDLLTRSLVWAHSYQEGGNESASKSIKAQPWMPTPPQSILPASWASSAPVVRDGRVVFTAPDGESVRCLNLRDGTLIWREPRQNDLYLGGVFADKVVLVGKEVCRALNFTDGKEVWKVSTGLPAGRGVCSGQQFFLPLKSGEVWTINLAKGEVEAKSRAARQAEGAAPVLPGNLVFHEGDVLSQSGTVVAVYPQLAAKENAITNLLKNNPNDPRGLTERGDLRLNRGELAGAVADLRAALAQQTIAADTGRFARERLYEALGDLLTKDFSANESLLAEYESLIPLTPGASETPEAKVRREEEERDRRARLFRIVARGREKQGRMKDALQAYLQFGRLGRKELLPIPEEQATRALPEVWIQGRISELLRQADSQQKKGLEVAFEEEWQAVRKKADLEAIEQFANLFGPICAQGQQARLLLAEKLVEQDQLEQAQIRLWSLARQAEPQLAAQALEGLARINTKQGELENAAYFYRVLAQRYPKVKLRDGKTAEEVYLDLATDKRFLPYLEEPRRGWILLGPGESLSGRTQTHISQEQRMGMPTSPITIEPDGDVPPSFRRQRLVIDANSNRFSVLDAATGANRGGFQLHPQYRPQPYNWSLMSRVRPVYRITGGVVVFAWGPMVYAYDPQKPTKALWTQSLLGNTDLTPNTITGQVPQMQVANNGQLVLLYGDGFLERIGALGPAQPNQVCYTVRDEGLVAVDPTDVVETPGDKARPVKRWVKSDIAIGTEMFGDGEHIYLLQQGRTETSPVRGTALRAIDGTPVSVPDFGELYQRRLKLVGRCLLLRETAEKSGGRLRLYDVHTGKDVWSRDLPEQAILLDSHADELAGFVTAEGQLTVLDVASGREALRAKLDPTPLAKSPDVRLLRDAAQLFIVFNLPVEANVRPGRRQVMPFNPLNTVAVNGPLYAFDRGTGKERWRRDVPPQMLIVDHFANMPILLFASNQMQANVPPGAGAGQLPIQTQVSPVLALDKRDGFDGRGGKANGSPEDAIFAQNLGPSASFYQLVVEPRRQEIELYTPSNKVVFKLAGATAQADPSPRESPNDGRRQMEGQFRIQAERLRLIEDARRQEAEALQRILEKAPPKKP
jgi:outer membrane protein assembly factor BamB